MTYIETLINLIDEHPTYDEVCHWITSGFPDWVALSGEAQHYLETYEKELQFEAYHYVGGD